MSREKKTKALEPLLPFPEFRLELVRNDLLRLGELAIDQFSVNEYAMQKATELLNTKSREAEKVKGVGKLNALIEEIGKTEEIPVESTTQSALDILGELDRRRSRIGSKTIVRDALAGLHPDKNILDPGYTKQEEDFFKSLSMAMDEDNPLLEQTLFAQDIAQADIENEDLAGLELRRYKAYIALGAGKAGLESKEAVDEWADGELEAMDYDIRVNVMNKTAFLYDMTLGIGYSAGHVKGIDMLTDLLRNMDRKMAPYYRSRMAMIPDFDQRLTVLVREVTKVYKRYAGVDIQSPTNLAHEKSKECLAINGSFEILANLIKHGP